MKRVIDGKMYNTETATLIGGKTGYPNEFYQTRTALFRTKKGAYFLAHWSSAGGKYGTSEGNTQYAGSNIEPCDEARALEWASHNLNGDDVQKFFAHLISEA